MASTLSNPDSVNDRDLAVESVVVESRWWPIGASAVILLVVSVVFRGYFTGQTVAPWDFIQAATDIYSRWDLGSFFTSPAYLPYTLGGYPGAVNLGTGAWYLPVGIAAEIFEYTPHTAAIVQALTVWAGCVGVLQLLRSWGIKTPIALICAVGFIFTPGFISQAEHTNQVIAWAILPWLLLLLTPRSAPRLWVPLVATVVWWQFFVGAYPGVIASLSYIFAVFVVVLLVRNRRVDWKYVTYALLPVVAGLLMSALLWVPYALTASGTPANENLVMTDLGSVALILFPFGSPQLSNDIVLRSWFVAPVILMAVFFIRRLRPIVVVGVALVVTSAVLGTNFSFGTGWQNALPLLNISRFRVTEFKISLILGIFMLAAAGLQAIIELRPKPADQRFALRRGVIALLVMATIIVCGFASPLSANDRSLGVLWAVASIVALFGVIVILTTDQTTRRSWLTSIAMGIITAAVVAVGYSWASSTSITWSVDRAASEEGTWGATATALIDRQLPTVLTSRPPRSAPSFPVPAQILKDDYWGSAAYSRAPSIGGYTNLRGQKIYQELVDSAPQLADKPMFDLLDQGSGAWIVTPGLAKSSSELAVCILDGSCVETGTSATTTRWAPGDITVNVTGAGPGQLVLNELGWRGWQAEACTSDGSCSLVSPTSSPDNLYLSAPVDKTTATVHFTYHTAGLRVAWFLFALGITVGGVATWFCWWKRPRRQKQTNPGVSDRA